mgnify:CR=1 FL=1
MQNAQKCRNMKKEKKNRNRLINTKIEKTQ